MIEGLKPYPAMKDSGVPWLGEVPEHWELPRLGALLQERGEVNSDGCITEVLSVTKDRGVIPYAEKGNIGNKKSDDITRYKIVRPDDIVVNCMNVIIGSVGLSRYTGCLSPVYYVLSRRSEDDNPRYLNTYFQSKPFQESLVRIGNGILAHRMRIPMELLKKELFPRPPACEQAVIVRFLHHADLKIRRYIRAKQKLIKLLEEQKQAIIHSAVTRGLDPTVRLKPSGVEWLGVVPEHWAVRRAKYLFREVDFRSASGTETHLAMSQKLGLVPSGMVQSTLRSETYAGGKLCSTGDLVLNRLKAHLGVFAVAKQSGVISPDYTVLRKQNGVHAEYFECILRSPECRGELRIRAKGIVEGFWRLYTDDFYNICLPVPSLREQQQIMQSIAHQTREQAGAISRLECEVSLLREYRTRLIADVVTGKLEVREAAAQLPDEEQDLQRLDESDEVIDSEEDPLDDLHEDPEEPEP